MVTVEPLVDVVDDDGTWLNTVPFAYCDGPDPWVTVTWNPSWVRIDWAVCAELPMTLGTAPALCVEVESVLTLTLNPSPCSVDSAWFCCSPTTPGTLTGAAPFDTY